jgi:hypothetical protein
VIKSRRKGTGHVAWMGRGEVHTGFKWGDMKERFHLEKLRVDGRVILKWVLKNRMDLDWIDLA